MTPAERPVDEARATGVDLVSPEGVLTDVTRRVLEMGLELYVCASSRQI